MTPSSSGGVGGDVVRIALVGLGERRDGLFGSLRRHVDQTHLQVTRMGSPIQLDRALGDVHRGREMGAALAAIWREGYRYKKAGVMFVDLVKASSVGSALFDQRDDARSLARKRALDGLNAQFGRDAVTMGRTALTDARLERL